jgi:glycosyltransferase involved in cell wall biosynthesis
MGFAEEDELVKTYDRFNIFFYPSKEEGSSLPILDAMARGIPVVIYKDNMMDTEIMKYCYVAYTPKDAKQIIEKIHKNKYDKTRVKKALKFARSLSWDKVAKETIECYESVIT